MARLGRTIKQITSIHRVTVDVFPTEAPGALVVSFLPSKAADERLIKYVQNRMLSQDLGVRKKAMADYLLVVLHSWNLVTPKAGEDLSIQEVPCPLCDTAGQVVVQDAYEEQVEVVQPGQTEPMLETRIVPALMEECPYCNGAGVVPQEAPADSPTLPEPVELAPGEVEVSIEEAHELGLDDTEDVAGPDDEQEAEEDEVQVVDQSNPLSFSAMLGEGAAVAVTPEDMEPVEGDPLPISRASLNALGLYYMAAIMGAIQRRFGVGKSKGSTSTTT